MVSVSRFVFKTSDKMEVMLQLNSTYVSRHTKKLRSLLINPKRPGKMKDCALERIDLLLETIATTSLDGTLRFWELSKSQISSNQHALDKVVSCSKFLFCNLNVSSFRTH